MKASRGFHSTDHSSGIHRAVKDLFTLPQKREAFESTARMSCMFPNTTKDGIRYYPKSMFVQTFTDVWVS